jgi:hypothetical protein
MIRTVWGIVAGVFMSLLAGCGGNGGGGNGGTNGDVEIPETTKLLSETALQDLVAVSPGQETFTFSRSSAQLSALRTGDVIVSGISEPLLPNGALRRVVSVDDTAQGVVVATTAASLADAIEKGSIHTRVPLETDPRAPSAAARGANGLGQLVFPFDNVVLFDGDGDEVNSTNDQVVLDGNLGLAPDVILDIDIDGFELQSATIAIETTATTSLTIEAGREATFPYEETLLTLPLGKVVVPIGPIPVVFVPILEIRAGADGTISAKTTADITLQADTRIGLGYDGSFGPILEVDPSGNASVPSFQDGSKGSAMVWIGAMFKVSVYGIAGVAVESRFYGQLDVDAQACPWWQLDAGVQGLARAFAEVSVDFWVGLDADVEIFEFETDPLDEHVTVAEAEGCAPSASQSGLDVLNWARTYGGESIDHPVALAATPEGGAVVAGESYSFTTGGFGPVDAWLLKLDALGHVAWEVAFDHLDSAVAVARTENGYYLLAGEVSLQSEYPSYLLRLNASGVPLWAKALWVVDPPLASGQDLELPLAICPLGSTCGPLDATALVALPDGGAAVAGTFREQDQAEVWVSRFDDSGAVLWSQTLAGGEVKSMALDGSGRLVVLADTPGVECSWLLRFDQDGSVLSQACYGGSHNSFSSDVVPAADGAYIVADTGDDIEVTRIDEAGGRVWVFHYDTGSDYPPPPPGRDEETCGSLDQPFDDVDSAALLPDGDVLLAGSQNLGADADLWAVRVNPDGSVEWSRRYGGPASDEAGGFNQYGILASTVLAAPDGGAWVAGSTQSFGAGSVDVWVLKIRSTGSVDLDAASGASSGPAGGGSCDREHFIIPTTVTPAPLALTVLDYTPMRVSTQATVVRQGGPD